MSHLRQPPQADKAQTILLQILELKITCKRSLYLISSFIEVGKIFAYMYWWEELDVMNKRQFNIKTQSSLSYSFTAYACRSILPLSFPCPVFVPDYK